MRRLGRVLALVTLAVACSDVQRLNLPTEPEADVAFGVLYDGQTPVQLGPVVPPGVIYSGAYVLRDRDDLSPRLFFMRKDDLLAAGRIVCRGLQVATERALCLSAVAACDDDPIACVEPATGEDACQDRLRYPGSLPVLAFISTEGIFRSTSTDVDALAGLSVCGPVIRPPCPNLLPGFVITDDAGYRCLAAAEQTNCALTIDLSECGLGSVSAEIEASGQLTNVSGACRVEAVTTAPALGDGAAVTLTCSERTFVATATGEQLVEPGCLRDGPANYQTDLTGRSDRVGRMAGLVAIQPTGWPVRWAMTGVGFDSCADDGCQTEGIDCGQECNLNCDTFDIQYCARGPWATCTGLDRQTTCKDRCRTFCQRASTDKIGCQRVSRGEIVALSDPATPEQTVHRVGLSDELVTAVGTQGIVALAPDSDPTLVAAGRSRVYALRPNGVDNFVVSSNAQLDFVTAGLAIVDPLGDLVAFGTNATDVGRWVRLTVDGGLVAIADGPFDILELPEATLGTVQDQVLFLASRRESADQPPVLVSVDLSSRVPLVRSLPGPATDIAALPNGSVLISFRTETGGGIAMAANDNGAVISTNVLAGLRPQALAVDPQRCSATSCLVWVAYEPVAVAGSAVLGRIIVTGSPGQIDIPSALSGLPMDRVDMLEVDARQDQVIAVHTSLDQVSPLTISIQRSPPP